MGEKKKQGPLRVKLHNSLFIFKVSGFLVAIAEKDKLIPHVAPDKTLSVFQGKHTQLVSGLGGSLLKVNTVGRGWSRHRVATVKTLPVTPDWHSTLETLLRV